jgi:hypothetical protein
MQKFPALLAAAPALALLAACGGGPEFRATLVPGEPFKAYGIVQVTPLSVDSMDKLDPHARGNAIEAAAELTVQLQDRLPSAVARSGRKLVVRGQLISFNPGSPAAEYWRGFGVGVGEVVADVAFENDSGTVVARGFAVGSVTDGWHGGSLRGAAKRMAKAIVDFVRDNFDAVTSRTTGARAGP